LLRAALDLYTTIGFRATTTPAIAARAGVAEGTIYRHFSGKEHLLNEVYQNAQQWGAGVVRELGTEEVPDRLRSIARRLLDRVREGDPYVTFGLAQYEVIPWVVGIGKEDLDRISPSDRA